MSHPSSPLTLHSLLTTHSSHSFLPLTHSSSLTPPTHSSHSLLPPTHSSLLTPPTHSSHSLLPLTPHHSLLTTHSSPFTPHHPPLPLTHTSPLTPPTHSSHPLLPPTPPSPDGVASAKDTHNTCYNTPCLCLCVQRDTRTDGSVWPSLL